MIDQSGTNSIIFAKEISNRLDQRIHNSITELRIIALDPQIKDLVAQSNREFEKIDDVDSFLAEKDAEWRSYEGKENPISNEMIKNPLSQRLEIFRQKFKESAGVDIFPEIMITNKHGGTIAENNRLSDWDQSDEKHFQNTRDYGWYVGDMYFDKSADVWALEVAVEITNGDDFAGMVKTAFAIEEIRDILINSKETSSYNDFRVFLFTNDNRYIYSDDPNVGEIGDDATSTFIGYERHSTEEGHYITDVFGINRLTAWSTSDGYRDFPGFGWMVVLSIPEQEFLRPINDIQNNLIGIMVFAIASGIAISILVVKSSINPIKKLEKDDKTKTMFLNNLTHELQTPLVPIQGNAEMLNNPKMGELNEMQKESVDEIYEHSKHLLNIVENFIKLQKIIENKLELDIKEIKMSELHEVISKITPGNDKKKINLEIVFDKKLSVNADKSELIGIIKELIHNTTDFLPEQDGKIEISTKEQDENVIFSVKDNGTGIPKEKLKEIFKPFIKADMSQSRTHGGVGLGLSICKGLIEGMNGKMWVESEEGQGTTFFFTIPKVT